MQDYESLLEVLEEIHTTTRDKNGLKLVDYYIPYSKYYVQSNFLLLKKSPLYSRKLTEVQEATQLTNNGNY